MMRRSRSSFGRTARLFGLFLLAVLPCIAATMGPEDKHTNHNGNVDSGNIGQQKSVSGEERMTELIDEADSISNVADSKSAAQQGNLHSLNRNFDDLNGNQRPLKNMHVQVSMHIGHFIETTTKLLSEFSSWTSDTTSHVAGELQKGATQTRVVLGHAASNALDYSNSASAKLMASGGIGVGRIMSSIAKGSNSIAEFSSVFARRGKSFAVEARRVLMKEVQGIQLHSSEAIASMQRGIRATSNQAPEAGERRNAAVSGDNSIESIGQNEHIIIAGDHSFNWMMIVIAFACISFLTMSFVVVRRIRTDESNNTESNNTVHDDEEMLVFEEATKFISDCCFSDDLEYSSSNNDNESPGMVEPKTEVMRDGGRSVEKVAGCDGKGEEEDRKVDISLSLGGDGADQMTGSTSNATHCEDSDFQEEVASCLGLKEEATNELPLLSTEVEHTTKSMKKEAVVKTLQTHSIEEKYVFVPVHSSDTTHTDSLQKNSRSLSFDNNCFENPTKSKYANKPARDKSKRTKMSIVQLFMMVVPALFVVYITNNLFQKHIGTEEYFRKKSSIGGFGKKLRKMDEL